MGQKSRTESLSEQAVRLAEATSDAYSVDRYANWSAVVEMLLGRGFTEREAEAILRSKWTRWAADETEHLHDGYGQATAADLSAHLDALGDTLAAQVADLTQETFG